METELRIFKHIDCPAGKKCTSVRCLFRHQDEKDENQAAVGQPPGGLPGHGNSSEQLKAEGMTTKTPSQPFHLEVDGPDKKRLKTGEDEYDPTAPPLLLPDFEITTAEEPAAEIAPLKEAKLLVSDQPAYSKPNLSRPVPVSTGHASAGGPVALQRASISPPPLKRKRPDVSPAKPTSLPQGGVEVVHGKQPKKAEQCTPDNGKNRPPPAVSQPSPPQPRKPEGLNPRHLKSNPARFEVRYKLVKMLYEQYSRLNKELQKLAKDDATKKLLLSDQEIIWMALDEEETAAGRGPNYSSSLKSRIMACKKLTVEKWREERAEVVRKAEAVLSKDEADSSKDGEPVVITTGLTSAQEVLLLKAKLQTPIDDLANFGYVPKVPSEEDIAKAKEAEVVSQGWEQCDRCTRRFQVFPGRREEDGALTSGGKCTHHPGRTYIPNRQTNDRSIPEKQYRCCGETVGQSAGCTTKENHVFKTTDPKRLASLWNFAETTENPNAPKDRAVCFDCEMGYTVKGFELIRLTATSWPEGEELIDVLVRPFGEVLDLNSVYSGVWPEDILNARPFSLSKDDKPPPPNKGERKRLQMVSSPVVARDLLFSLISTDTPLIGHGLENDLNCLRVVHPTLVDTILLYPHKRGLPIRNGLRMLMQTILNKRIQVEAAEGELQGHDSAEDARAAGDLVRWKVKGTWEKMKREGWRIVDEQLVPPGKTTAS